MYGSMKCAILLCAAVAASSFSLSPTDVVFHLFTRTNPEQSHPMFASLPSILTSPFGIARRTIITIHSNGESVGGNFNAFLVPVELQAEDVNVVAVDWSLGSNLYTVGLANAPQVGELIAEFINILVTNFGYSANNVRIIGVGLGGHIAGIAARNIQGTIPHIIALDPSFHGWTHHPSILSPDDADVVEVLHTTAGITGYDYPLGDLDFYANGGSYQNGCSTDSSCAHIYSYAFYAESISSELLNGAQFIATECDSYEQAIIMNCSGNRNVVFGGRGTKTGVSGIYVFATNSVPPFAQN